MSYARAHDSTATADRFIGGQSRLLRERKKYTAQKVTQK
jgi:hypothetical protein